VYLAQSWRVSQRLMEGGSECQDELRDEKEQNGENGTNCLEEHTCEQQPNGLTAEQDDAVDAVHPALQLVWDRG